MPRTYQHLQLEERALIQTMLEQGYKPAAIASSLGRSRSTISRELSRNNYIAPSLPRPVGRPYLAGGYRCVLANQRARKLSRNPRVPRRMVAGTALWDCVISGLSQGLSPEPVLYTPLMLPTHRHVLFPGFEGDLPKLNTPCLSSLLRSITPLS